MIPEFKTGSKSRELFGRYAPGENVHIEMIGSERDLLNAIIEEVSNQGGRPFVQLTDRTVQRAMLKNANKERL